MSAQAARLGFTLAEVLITLGIIGIVAALTIPQLISGYKKRVVETKLQKVHSILSQAVRLSEAENDVAVNWNWPESVVDEEGRNVFFDKYFKPYMKIVDEERTYFIVYKPDGTRDYTEWHTYYKLFDGTFISFYISFDVHRNVYYASIEVILPGTNKDYLISGKDYFNFQINVSSNKTAVSVFPSTYGGLTCEGISNNLNYFVDKCKTATQGGYYCTALIYCNGWKIPDYYPVRF